MSLRVKTWPDQKMNLRMMKISRHIQESMVRTFSYNLEFSRFAMSLS